MPFSNKIKEIENNRNDSSMNRIYLYKDNGGWFSAYEWSAYLCEFFQNGLDEKKRLNPTKKLDNDKYPFIKVGFKLESIDKFLPETTYKEDDDGNLLIDVNLDNYIEYVMGDSYDKLLKEWKDKIEIKETKKKTNDSTTNTNNTISQKQISLVSVASKILYYDTNNKSREELVDFLNEMRKDYVKIFVGCEGIF